jgi:hypothetical protein
VYEYAGVSLRTQDRQVLCPLWVISGHSPCIGLCSRGHEWLRATPHTSCIFPSRSRFSISSGKGLGSLL